MAQDRGVLALGLGALIGGLLGAVLGAQFASPAPNAAEAAEAPDAQALRGLLEIQARMLQALEELTAVAGELQRMRRDHAPSERVPVEAPDEARVQLLEAIERLTLALQGSSTVHAARPSLRVPAAGSERATLARWVDQPREGWDQVSPQLRFSTMQQVLDRFGAPERFFQSTEGPRWIYEVEDHESGKDLVAFWFSEGYLYRVSNYP